MRAARVRPWLPLVLLLAALVAVAVISGPSQSGGPPLDPRSPKPLGTKGVVEVLRSLGATVDVTSAAPGPTVDTALILGDDLGPTRRQEVKSWVEAGGTLLLADPFSPLNPFEVGDTTDLAFGTSRWSSKLVHGGLRYLASGKIAIAHESAVERGILIEHTAPHLVRPFPQLFPFAIKR